MNYKLISFLPLFYGCTEDDVKFFEKLGAIEEKKYFKDEYILREGCMTKDIGIVLSGSVRVERADINGQRTVLGITGAGEEFAEAYACLEGMPMLVDAVANEDSTVLQLAADKLFSLGDRRAGSAVLKNLIKISAEKKVRLSARGIHTSYKTIRGRLLSYLVSQRSFSEEGDIVIPFDRQQLADYLGVDRSALSKEIGRLKKLGVIDCRKNIFRLYKTGHFAP